MSSIRAYRYALRLKPVQERQLTRYAGQLRWLWNHALAEQRARYARGEKYASYVDMAKWLTAWRNALETHWLAEGPVHPQQQVLKQLDAAYQRFFKNVKAGKTPGHPRFKTYGLVPGIRFPDPKQFELDQANSRIKVPKLGWLRLRLSQPVTGELRNVTLTWQGGRWYCAIQTQGPEVLRAGLAPSLGIDMGIAAFAGLSSGTLIEPLNALKKQACRLRRYQRAVSRKVKGSCNRKKAAKRLAALHLRIAHQRNDWLHKLTTELASEHPVIALEDLKVASMSASAKGTATRPGKSVRAKAGLNRSILEQAWGEFRRQLEYKLAAAGGEVIVVNPAYTSRTCRICGRESADNRKTQSLFACMACGHTEQADINASKNILAAGHAVWFSQQAGPMACGGDVRHAAIARPRRAAPVKQEPTEELTHA